MKRKKVNDDDEAEMQGKTVLPSRKSDQEISKSDFIKPYFYQKSNQNWISVLFGSFWFSNMTDLIALVLLSSFQ